MPIIKSGAGLTQRTRHADDRAGQHAGHRQRQHMVRNHLNLRGAHAERGFRIEGGTP